MLCLPTPLSCEKLWFTISNWFYCWTKGSIKALWAYWLELSITPMLSDNIVILKASLLLAGTSVIRRLVASAGLPKFGSRFFFIGSSCCFECCFWGPAFCFTVWLLSSSRLRELEVPGAPPRETGLASLERPLIPARSRLEPFAGPRADKTPVKPIESLLVESPLRLPYQARLRIVLRDRSDAKLISLDFGRISGLNVKSLLKYLSKLSILASLFYMNVRLRSQKFEARTAVTFYGVPLIIFLFVAGLKVSSLFSSCCLAWARSTSFASFWAKNNFSRWTKSILREELLSHLRAD